VGGGIRVGKDVVPFSMAAGDPLRIYGLNRVGLRRAGFSMERMKAIKAAYRILFWSGLTMTAALERLKAEMAGNEDVSAMVKFAEGSKRGLTPGLTVKSGGEGAEKEAE
jgi:UDP-N-acetylglucosamine acyltransferase